MLWLDTFDDARFLNNIYAYYFYQYKSIVQFHVPLLDYQCGIKTRRNMQRRDQCIDVLQTDMSFVLPSIINHLTEPKMRVLVQNTLNRVVNYLKNPTESSEPSNITEEFINAVDYIIRNYYLGILVPKLKPNEKLHQFLQNIDDDTLLSGIIEKSKTFRQQSKKLNS